MHKGCPSKNHKTLSHSLRIKNIKPKEVTHFHRPLYSPYIKKITKLPKFQPFDSHSNINTSISCHFQTSKATSYSPNKTNKYIIITTI